MIPDMILHGHSNFNSNVSPDSPFTEHISINLLNKFNHGDKILIRFRLFADEFVTGWGWVIDNIEYSAICFRNKR